MPTSLKRVKVTPDVYIYEELEKLAAERGMPIATLAGHLIAVGLYHEGRILEGDIARPKRKQHCGGDRKSEKVKNSGKI
jgi:hypothetical protein